MRLLVVEDDRLLNNALCYNLSTAGYTVDAAITKSEAVSLCQAQDYDLIVLDVNLPDRNGFDFCREIKERRPDTAVIFLTANDMESDQLRGFELGADDYVKIDITDSGKGIAESRQGMIFKRFYREEDIMGQFSKKSKIEILIKFCIHKAFLKNTRK